MVSTMEHRELEGRERAADWKEIVNLTLEGSFFSEGGKLRFGTLDSDILKAVSQLMGAGYLPEGRLEIRMYEKAEPAAYRGIGPNAGLLVEEVRAFDYVKEHLDELPDRDRKELVEFFFSGDWIGIDDDGLPF